MVRDAGAVAGGTGLQADSFGSRNCGKVKKLGLYWDLFFHMIIPFLELSRLID